jgi:hypothetical protein
VRAQRSRTTVGDQRRNKEASAGRMWPTVLDSEADRFQGVGISCIQERGRCGEMDEPMKAKTTKVQSSTKPSAVKVKDLKPTKEAKGGGFNLAKGLRDAWPSGR